MRGCSRGQGWVAIAGSLPPLLGGPQGSHPPGRAAPSHPWAFPVASRFRHLPYFPFTFKRMTVMTRSEPRKRIPRMMQRMRRISSRDSSVFTVTEGSESKNPKSGRKRNGHRRLLVLLVSPSCLQLIHSTPLWTYPPLPLKKKNFQLLGAWSIVGAQETYPEWITD